MEFIRRVCTFSLELLVDGLCNFTQQEHVFLLAPLQICRKMFIQFCLKVAITQISATDGLNLDCFFYQIHSPAQNLLIPNSQRVDFYMKRLMNALKNLCIRSLVISLPIYVGFLNRDSQNLISSLSNKKNTKKQTFIRAFGGQ